MDGFKSKKLVKDFSDLYLRDDVVAALQEVGVTKPTVIQMLSIPKIVRGKNVFCASETGECRILFCMFSLFHQLVVSLCW